MRGAAEFLGEIDKRFPPAPHMRNNLTLRDGKLVVSLMLKGKRPGFVRAQEFEIGDEDLDRSPKDLVDEIEFLYVDRRRQPTKEDGGPE